MTTATMKPFLGLVVLGACLLANPGSAETLEPSAATALHPASFSGAGFGSSEVPGSGWSTLQVRRYYKQRPVPPPPPIRGWLETRGGFFDGDDVSGTDWMVGMKMTGVVGEVMRFGIMSDFQHRYEANRLVTSEYFNSSGQYVVDPVWAFQGESSLFPLMGVMEFHLPAGAVDPYFGGGAGWEWLDINGLSSPYGYWSDANFNGFGYQVYGGMGLALAPRTRLTFEGFWNGSTVSRDIYDPFYGIVATEKIKLDGFGGRGGFSFAF